MNLILGNAPSVHPYQLLCRGGWLHTKLGKGSKYKPPSASQHLLPMLLLWMVCSALSCKNPDNGIEPEHKNSYRGQQHQQQNNHIIKAVQPSSQATTPRQRWEFVALSGLSYETGIRGLQFAILLQRGVRGWVSCCVLAQEIVN